MKIVHCYYEKNFCVFHLAYGHIQDITLSVPFVVLYMHHWVMKN